MNGVNKTGTNVGYECLLDERGDNGAFANTLWEVRCVIVSLCYAYQDKKRHTVTDQ
jgi:hypothetical protein